MSHGRCSVRTTAHARGGAGGGERVALPADAGVDVQEAGAHGVEEGGSASAKVTRVEARGPRRAPRSSAAASGKARVTRCVRARPRPSVSMCWPSPEGSALSVASRTCSGSAMRRPTAGGGAAAASRR